MSLREAAQAALEALERGQHKLVQTGECRWESGGELAITAHRAALSAPEFGASLGEVAAPEAEPVRATPTIDGLMLASELRGIADQIQGFATPEPMESTTFHERKVEAETAWDAGTESVRLLPPQEAATSDAERLAEILQRESVSPASVNSRAAVELRRLDAENRELRVGIQAAGKVARNSVETVEALILENRELLRSAAGMDDEMAARREENDKLESELTTAYALIERQRIQIIAMTAGLTAQRERRAAIARAEGKT